MLHIHLVHFRSSRSVWTAISTIMIAGLLFVALFVSLNYGELYTVAGVQSAGPLYVSTTGDDAKDCTSPGDACATLQRAIDLAATNDEIRVADGTYTDENNRDGTTQNAYITQTVSILGGWDAAFTTQDPTSQSTIFDAQNSGRVFRITAPATLNGLVLQGGNPGAGQDGGALIATAEITLDYVSVIENSGNQGGGIHTTPAITLTDSLIGGNQAALSGGGLFAQADVNLVGTTVMSNTVPNGTNSAIGGGAHIMGTAWITGSHILSNTTGFNGGGMYFAGDAFVEDTEFRANEADASGGAIYISSKMLHDTGSTFTKNHADVGGAITIALGASEITGTHFISNTANTDGGGVYAVSASSKLDSVRFIDNRSDSGKGGGYFVSLANSSTIYNTIFLGNYAGDKGGGLAEDKNSSKVVNSTFFANMGVNGGGAMYTDKGAPTVDNSIIWNNQAKLGTNLRDALLNENGGKPVFRSNIIQGCQSDSLYGTYFIKQCGSDGGGNLAIDPQFVDPVQPPDQIGSADLHLRITSPAINWGIDVPDLATDADGNPRVANGFTDLGAFERTISCPPSGTTRLYVDQSATGTGSGLDWDNALVYLQDALGYANACREVEEIWTASGIYLPDEGLEQIGDDRSSSFVLRPTVTVYGGFAGSEAALDQRDWMANLTVLSGDIDKNDVTDSQGLITKTTDIKGNNSYHVVNSSAVISATASNLTVFEPLDGFAITGGFGIPVSGAGIYNVGGQPDFRNLLIQGNQAGTLDPDFFTFGIGGGMYSLGDILLEDVIFRANEATWGGGLVLEQGAATLTRVRFEANVADREGGGLWNNVPSAIAYVDFIDNKANKGGGGLFNYTGRPQLTASSFEGNEAKEAGGGLLSFSDLGIVVTNVTFESNSAVEGGGIALSKDGTNSHIVQSDFINNAAQFGGGLFLDGITNTLKIKLSDLNFTNNQASEQGGGFYSRGQWSSGSKLSSSTFTNNSAKIGGGGFFEDISNFSVDDSSFTGNIADTGGGLAIDMGTLSLKDVSFDLNHAIGDFFDLTGGGGMAVLNDGSAIVDGGRFQGNTAANGGGILTAGSKVTLTDVSIQGNRAGNDTFGAGGGLFADGGEIEIRNSLFSGNASTSFGGGLICGGCKVELLNSAFSGNHATSDDAGVALGGGLYLGDAHGSVVNSFSWNNRDASGTGTKDSDLILHGDTSSLVTKNNLMQGWGPGDLPNGTNNLDGKNPSNAPKFIMPVDPATAPTAGGDLRVLLESSTVDAGDNASASALSTDLAGNPRIYHGIVDLGPYELQLACPPVNTARLYVDQAASGGNTGLNWDDALIQLRDAFTLIEKCSGITEIWAAKGSYYPDAGAEQFDNDRSESFRLENGVVIYGGFAGGETTGDQRDWRANQTLLSGDLDQNDGLSSWIATSNGIPAGTDITFVAIDPLNNNVRYAASFGAGIFKTTDGGQGWNPANNGLGTLQVNHVAVDPTNTGILYAATEDGGVYKSANGGANWSESSTGLASQEVNRVAVDPQNGSVLYVGTGAQVHKSVDGGSNWTPSSAGISPSDLTVLDVIIDPSNTSVLYAAAGSLVYKSTDGAASWNPTSTGLAGKPTSLAIDPTNSDLVYAGTIFGFYRSVDGGGSWSQSNDGLGGTPTYVRAIAVDPNNTQQIYAVLFQKGIFRSVNGGDHWALETAGLPTESNLARSVTMAKLTPGLVTAAYRTLGVYTAVDPSDTQQVPNPEDVTGSNSYHVVVGGGTDSTAVLDGFTVTAGLANGQPAALNDSGAGLFNDGGSPTVRHLTVTGNVGAEGGGMTNDNNSNATVINVLFQANLGTDFGGGMHNESSNPELINVVFSGNKADSGGGAIFNSASSPIMTNVTIAGNRAEFQGGGMYNTLSSKPEIRNTILWNNQDSTGIGTVSATTRNSTSSFPRFRYSLVQASGGSGSGWNDLLGLDFGDNIDDDPQFADPADPATAPHREGDLQLLASSPAVDAGLDSFNNQPTDLASQPRIQGLAVDLGAYETTPVGAITIHKSSDRSTAKFGDTITYSYQVVNSAALELTGITVVDDKLGSVTLGTTSLTPGETTTGTLTYTVQVSDLPGPLTNTALVEAIAATGPVSDTDSASVSLSYQPDLALSITADPATAYPGDVITYQYLVTNTGDVPLTNVAVVDQRLGAVTLSATSLNPGDSATGTLHYTVLASDQPGTLVNVVDATGDTPLGETVSQQKSTTVDVPTRSNIVYLPLLFK